MPHVTLWGGIGDEEFLYYFVSGQDGQPIFSVKSISKKEDYIVATIYIEQGEDGVPWDYSYKEIHTLRLIRDKEAATERYLIDDFDNTKQECLNYIEKMREAYKSGEFERSMRNEGASKREINKYRNSLRAFYAKYGDDRSKSTGRQVTSNPISSNSSRGTAQQTVSFTSPIDIASYLIGRRFSNSAGYTMSFSSSLEMAIEGTVLTGAMQIVDYTSSQAVISGVCPYDGGTLRLRIDATNGLITNIDEPSEVFRIK